MERKKYQYKIAVGLLISLHFFGFLGMKIAWMNDLLYQLTPFDSFSSLTPLNLIFTLSLLLFFHVDWNRNAVLFCLLTYLLGFLTEWVGVHTGWVFGQYWYGDTLGWKIDQIPVLIGANWLVLTYTVGALLHNIQLPNYTKPFIAACGLVVLDIFIEPVAIQYDFWQWHKGIVPLSNYIGWFVLAFLLSFLFHYLSFYKKNQLALPVLISQVLFFIAHNLIIDE